MKRVVWENKSNGQLCVTIPKDLGIGPGDIVTLGKERVKKVVYSTIAGDFFHYGHLHFLKKAKSLGDYHICGVLTDKAIMEHRKKPLTTLEERKAVISNLLCVDMVMVQKNLDPTENLKNIYDQFGDVEIILVHGDNWKEIPGAGFLTGKKGKTAKIPYYDRLSDFRIIKKLLTDYKTKFESLREFSDYFDIKDWPEFKENNKKHDIISTKAETLKSLKGILTKSRIEKPFIFGVPDWKRNPDRIIEKIQKVFLDKSLVVRSSAKGEDSFKESLAGKYASVLGVDSSNRYSIRKAVESVINSYGPSEMEEGNQILVQSQVKNVDISGVILTRDLTTGSPYYVINYDDDGSTDSVTKGIANKAVKISHFYDSKDSLGRWGKIIESVQELEKVIPGFPLDIEFAITKSGEIIFFQVRPLTNRIVYSDEKEDYNVKKSLNLVKEKFSRISKGENRLFSDMAFWNPAEIIGDSPNMLDYSLYEYLITNEMWQKALIENGYSKTSKTLMFLFGNKPYIDVVTSFKFLIPSQISKPVKKKLLNFYLRKLKENPELHDKIEFEIVHSCYTPNFDEKADELRKNGFNDNEINEIKKKAHILTNDIIKNYKKYIRKAKDDAQLLEAKRVKTLISSMPEASKIKDLLDDCKSLGTFHFSRIARFAFIGKAILSDSVKKGIVNEDFYDKFLTRLRSPARDLKFDSELISRNQMDMGNFLDKYGHLRPGTYDITSPRYSTYPKIFFEKSDIRETIKSPEDWKIPEEIINKVDAFLENEGFEFDAKHLFSFIRDSLEEREFLKFEFTKNISEVLEIIARLGDRIGLSREEISKLSINDILIHFENPKKMEINQLIKIIKSRKKIQDMYRRLLLPPIIFSDRDFDLVNLEKAKPNFITQKQASGKFIILNKSDSPDSADLAGKIVVIENADPGFDWILSKNITGLITKYGGAASHMAIRCSEFGIPAAIGCGENLFSKIQNSKMINIDCKGEKLEIF